MTLSVRAGCPVAGELPGGVAHDHGTSARRAIGVCGHDLDPAMAHGHDVG